MARKKPAASARTKFKRKLLGKMRKIKNVLKKLKIKHGHLHQGNFCVEMHKVRGELKPRLMSLTSTGPESLVSWLN